MVPGELAFKLYDTYGFPPDLTRVVAEGRGLRVDEAGFEAKMDEQRRRADFAGSGEAAVEGVYQSILERVGATTFLGYEATEAETEILAPDRRGHRGSGGERRRGPGGQRRGHRVPRRRFTGSRAARWATPAG